MARRISNQDLIDDLRQLAEQLGAAPTLNEYRENGDYGAQTLYDRFGSWNEALEAAGYDSREPNSKISKEDLIDELRTLAEELDQSPTREQMNNQGKHWGSTYIDRFGNWSSALEAANLEPRKNPEPSREELIEELRNLGKRLDKRPTEKEMASDGNYAPRTYHRNFESWNNALEAAGFEPRKSGVKLSKDELLTELRRLANELGERPAANDMDRYGRYASATYQSHFGKWSLAVEKAFEESDKE